jgi:hypothetical protein
VRTLTFKRLLAQYSQTQLMLLMLLLRMKNNGTRTHQPV